MNNMKVFVLMAGLTGLVVAVGQLIGGGTGAILALVLSGATKLFMSVARRRSSRPRSHDT